MIKNKNIEANKVAAIRRKIRNRINDLSSEVAKQTLEDIADLKKRNYGLGNRLWVRLLSGGYWSQSLDEFTMRELGVRAGFAIKGQPSGATGKGFEMPEKKCTNCTEINFCIPFQHIKEIATILNQVMDNDIVGKSGFENTVDTIAHDCKRFKPIT